MVFRSADKIIVLDKGEIVEEGPHDKLMMAKGAYYQLVLKQVRKDGEADETNEESSLDLDQSLGPSIPSHFTVLTIPIQSVISSTHQ